MSYDSTIPEEFWEFKRNLYNFFAESGRRAHILWRLDGSYGGLQEVSKEIVNPPGGGSEGIWVEPLKLMDYLHFHLWTEESGLVPVESYPKDYIKRVGYSEILYQFSTIRYLDIVKRVWVPLDLEAVVIEVELINKIDEDKELKLFAVGKSRLTLGWPRRESGIDSCRYDESQRGVIIHSTARVEWTVIWGSDLEPVAYHLGDFQPYMIGKGGLEDRGTIDPAKGISCLQYNLKLPANEHQKISFFVTGSDEGEKKARKIYSYALGHKDDLFKEKVDHYTRIFEDTTQIETPDFAFDKTFLWAKIAQEDFKHYDPNLGLCYFAGYPAYNFYFAGDSMRVIRGTTCFGDFEDIKSILRMITSYQATTKTRDQLPGEIWHEMSTTGDTISPNFVTLEFPQLLKYFYDWSGDREFLREMYPKVQSAMDWAYLNDLDGDGLLENYPEGEMADTAFEDTNMEGSHYGVNLHWFYALRTSADIAEELGDEKSATKWRKTADALKPKLNTIYWNEVEKKFEETIRPEGVLDSSIRGVKNADPEVVDEGKAVLNLEMIARAEERLTTLEGFLATKRKESTFGTWRSFMSYYVMARGGQAGELIKSHLAQTGFKALKEIARIPFHWEVPGFFPEVMGIVDPATQIVRGCFHQAWSPTYGFVYPVIDGLVGIKPDAPRHSITIDPHLPSEWQYFKIKKLRLGEHLLEISYEKRDNHAEVSIYNDSEEDLQTIVGFAFPQSFLLFSVKVGDKVLALDDEAISRKTTPYDTHLYVKANVSAGDKTIVRIEYAPANISLKGERFLKRVSAGEKVAVPLTVENRSFEALRGKLAIALPEGWRGMILEQEVEIPPGEEKDRTFLFEVPSVAEELYYTLKATLTAPNGLLVEKLIYLPVYQALAFSVDGRKKAKVSKEYVLTVKASNLSESDLQAKAELTLPDRFSCACEWEVEAERTSQALFKIIPSQAGEYKFVIHTLDERNKVPADFEHIVKVIGEDRLFLLYSGFLGCPIESGEEWEVVNMPANYALRKPYILEQLLPHADLFLTSDQHDAIFSPEQIDEIIEYVENGGRLILFCYWSSPWGRGFCDTYGNVASSRLVDILPLRMKKIIGQAERIIIKPEGEAIYKDIAWDTCPPYDFNLAELKDGAKLLAETERGEPLIAWWSYGKGRVMTIAIDCFGYGSYGSFIWWNGQRKLIEDSIRMIAS